MARHRKYEAAEEANPALDISSLIDVCFLLLIYFIVTSTIAPRETDLGMALPSPTPGEKQPEIEPMFIRVEGNGALYIGTGAAQEAMDSDPGGRDVPLLRSRLSLYADAARAANSTPIVQIYVNGEATQQRVIDVLNALAGVSINSVTFTDLLN